MGRATRTERLPNVFRPLFGFIFIQQNNQSTFSSAAPSSVCKFSITAICKTSHKCRQNKTITGYGISRRWSSNLQDWLLEGTRSGIVALSEAPFMRSRVPETSPQSNEKNKESTSKIRELFPMFKI